MVYRFHAPISRWLELLGKWDLLEGALGEN